MSKTTLKSCTCKHPFQDETYGKGKRVFNAQMNKSRIDGYTCTVCSREVKADIVAPKKEEEKTNALSPAPSK